MKPVGTGRSGLCASPFRRRRFAGYFLWCVAAGLLLFFCVDAALAALPPEPDWKARFNYWTARGRRSFPEPRLNTDWTGTLKSGVTVTGVLMQVTESGVEVADGMNTSRYERIALSREDRMRLFPEDYARGRALERVMEEKHTYQRQSNPLLPAQLITKLRLLTSVQFDEYARGLSGYLLLQEGWVQDVRLDYFGGSQAVVSLTPLDQDGLAVVCVFPVDAEEAGTLQKGAVIRFFGPIRSVRAYPGIIRVTLRDISIDGMKSPVDQPETGENNDEETR
ncbi:MAG: hypothetical protein PHG65_03960 [Kiritimatiellae bacterium]|nr:hypothetical protein [Kiritimatiellia bacterium]